MKMPGSQSNIFKCDKCRKDFTHVWIPNKLCCRIAMGEKHIRSLGNTYSRHMTQQLGQFIDSHAMPNNTGKKANFTKDKPASPPEVDNSSGAEMGKNYRNCIAPFSSLGKPTCGHFFSRETDHRKRKTGIPPSNLVEWRSYIS